MYSSACCGESHWAISASLAMCSCSQSDCSLSIYFSLTKNHHEGGRRKEGRWRVRKWMIYGYQCMYIYSFNRYLHTSIISGNNVIAAIEPKTHNLRPPQSLTCDEYQYQYNAVWSQYLIFSHTYIHIWYVCFYRKYILWFLCCLTLDASPTPLITVLLMVLYTLDPTILL